jgi:hypothetical protein
MSYSARALARQQSVMGGCERFEECPLAVQENMIGRRLCMPVLKVLGGLSVNTPENNISQACSTVRTEIE